jgi:hypothetical protein
MTHESTRFGGSRSRLGLALASLALCVLAGLTVANLADGARKAKVLGETRAKHKPTCPKEACQATAKVTGFQTAINGEKQIFKAPKNGHIVAWSIDLAKPDRTSLDFFESTLASSRFGSGSFARIGVLNPKGKAKFKLTKQTPAVDLTRSLGDRPIFTLGKPIRVKKGRVLAVTVPSWTTNFALNAGGNSQWLASRNPKRCNVGSGGEENREKSRPQMKVGTTRKYGCRYSGERILYWVYFLPEKKKSGGGKSA